MLIARDKKGRQVSKEVVFENYLDTATIRMLTQANVDFVETREATHADWRKFQRENKPEGGAE